MSFDHITQKFKVYATPDTVQSVYLGVYGVHLDVDILEYADGSLRVVIPNVDQINHRFFSIVAHLETMDDLMVVAQLKDIIERNVKNPCISFTITSPMYSRYDRVMFDNKADSFGAKVFATFVNALNFDNVTLVDCHSEVLLDLIHRSTSMSQEDCLNATIISQYLKAHVIAPDKGARKKLKTYVASFDKARDLETGKIKGLELAWINEKMYSSEHNSTNEFLVVDDLCEKGGTFIGLANVFNESFKIEHKYPLELNLYVTHGIFPDTENTIPKLLEKYVRIYVYIMKETTYNKIPEDLRHRINVKFLVSDYEQGE